MIPRESADLVFIPWVPNSLFHSPREPFHLPQPRQGTETTQHLEATQMPAWASVWQSVLPHNMHLISISSAPSFLVLLFTFSIPSGLPFLSLFIFLPLLSLLLPFLLVRLSLLAVIPSSFSSLLSPSLWLIKCVYFSGRFWPMLCHFFDVWSWIHFWTCLCHIFSTCNGRPLIASPSEFRSKG